MRVDFTWRGEAAKAGAKDAARAGLFRAGEYLLSHAKAEVPVDDGILRASGAVTAISDKKVAVSFNTPYAVRQHEELSYRHPKHGKAKYLEDPFNASRQAMLRIINRAISTFLGR